MPRPLLREVTMGGMPMLPIRAASGLPTTIRMRAVLPGCILGRRNLASMSTIMGPSARPSIHAAASFRRGSHHLTEMSRKAMAKAKITTVQRQRFNFSTATKHVVFSSTIHNKYNYQYSYSQLPPRLPLTTAAAAVAVGVLGITTFFMGNEKQDSQTVTKTTYSALRHEKLRWRHPRPEQQHQHISFFMTPTACEASNAVVENDNNQKQQGEEEEEEDDPYANLPEDEPTDCSMCLTFRQGPCRPYWRKLERCFKDTNNNNNDNDKTSKDSNSTSSDASRCVRYFTPHQHCLMQYMNLYLLIQHEMKQELVQDIEAAFPKDQNDSRSCRKSMEMPSNIDWSLWYTFLQEQGPDFRETIPREKLNDDKNKGKGESSSKKKKKTKKGNNKTPMETEQTEKETTPLWKRLPPETEPVLVYMTAHLPNLDPETPKSTRKEPLILKIAYMVDQDGKVVGFAFNEVYSTLLKESKNEEGTNDDKANSSTTETAESNENKNGEKEVPLEFIIMPGETKAIQLKAFYSENPVTAPSDKAVLDGCLYSTPLMTVPTKVPESKKTK